MPAKVSEKHEVFEYFGTTARVMLTMFELTLANLAQRLYVPRAGVLQQWLLLRCRLSVGHAFGSSGS